MGSSLAFNAYVIGMPGHAGIWQAAFDPLATAGYVGLICFIKQLKNAFTSGQPRG